MRFVEAELVRNVIIETGPRQRRCFQWWGMGLPEWIFSFSPCKGCRDAAATIRGAGSGPQYLLHPGTGITGELSQEKVGRGYQRTVNYNWHDARRHVVSST